MNTVSIISLCIAFLSFIFNTIWSANTAKKAREKEYRDIIAAIKAESSEKSEMQVLFREMNKNLERIVEDNKIMNERIYNLAERVAILEHDQKGFDVVTTQIPILTDKTDRAHQRLDILEHDLEKLM